MPATNSAIAARFALGLTRALSIASALSATTAFAQQPAPNIPIRTLSEPQMVSPDTLGPRVIARELSNGNVLASDVSRRRVLLFSATSASGTVVFDSTGRNIVQQSPNLIRFKGDSTFYVDVLTQSVLVLDPNGKESHVMSLPRSKDVVYLASPAYGAPGVDPKGRLVYQGVIEAPRVPLQRPAPGECMKFPMSARPDSGAIVRADFEARTIDTVAKVKLRRNITTVETFDAQCKMQMKQVWDPTASGDEWAMLGDGSVAVVRGHDYHIDWVDSDGTHRSTPKMPFDWKRLTDQDKQLKIDSIRAIVERPRPPVASTLGAPPSAPVAAPSAAIPRMTFEYPPLDKMADYEPPIGPGTVSADLTGNVWILPRTSRAAQPGLLYDVVNRQGEIAYRVQLPSGYALAGFGDRGIVYLVRVLRSSGVLMRAKLQ